MKNKNLSWFAALLVFALLLWCTAATPGKIADPSTYTCAVYSTIFSLLPPVIAIVLALNTKEVYTSLLVGIASGALLYANGNLELAINTLFFNEDGGMVAKLSDSSNVGILVFLVMLGILVALMNKAGGSAAFGRWASTHIHSRAGAQFATLLLGVMIFVDDYFNCLTVGSVMRPVTDRQKVSRAKLAYLIDATAAPVCIIAPVSSWAAAVTSSVPEGSGINGFTMFLRTIPYNYYALLTIVMSLFLIFTGTDFGSMKLNEDNAKNGDLFTTADSSFTLVYLFRLSWNRTAQNLSLVCGELGDIRHADGRSSLTEHYQGQFRHMGGCFRTSVFQPVFYQPHASGKGKGNGILEILFPEFLRRKRAQGLETLVPDHLLDVPQKGDVAVRSDERRTELGILREDVERLFQKGEEVLRRFRQRPVFVDGIHQLL